MKSFMDQARKNTADAADTAKRYGILRDAYQGLVKETVSKVLKVPLDLSNLTLTYAENHPSDGPNAPVTGMLTNTDGTDITVEKFGELKELNEKLHKRGLHAVFMHPDPSYTYDEPSQKVYVVFHDLAQIIENTFRDRPVTNPEQVVSALHEAGWISHTYPFWTRRIHASQLNDTLEDNALPQTVFDFLKVYVSSHLGVRLLASMYDAATETLIFAYCPKYMVMDGPVFADDIRWQLACNQGELDMMRMDAPEAMRDAIRQVIQGLRFCKSVGEFVKHCECSGIGTDFIPPGTMVGNGLKQNITKDLEATILYAAMVRPIFTSKQERLKETAGMTVDLTTGTWTTTYEYEGLLESLRYMIKAYERNTRRKFFKE